jgi:uncharacterized protein (TIGR03086 family)
MSNSGWAVLDQAHHALRTAVAGIRDDQWGAATPCSEWTVTQVFQHAVGDQQAYSGSVTGTGFPEENPFQPSGTLTADPLETLDKAVAATASAYSGVTPDQTEVPVPLPQGPLPAPVAAGAAALDAAVHAWDIAVATGQAPLLDDSLAAALLEVAPQIVEPVRDFAFAPSLEGAAGESPRDALLRYVGRDPAWSPAS